MENEVSLVGGNSFLVSDKLGDITGGNEGLFSADTRLLSTYILKINGSRLTPLNFGLHGHDAASFYLTNPKLDGLDRGCLTVVRERHINSRLSDHLTILNYSQKSVEFDLSIEISADFADIFEVRGMSGIAGRATVIEQTSPGELSLLYHRNGFKRGAVIGASGDPRIEGSTFLYRVKIAPRDRWDASLHLTPAINVADSKVEDKLSKSNGKCRSRLGASNRDALRLQDSQDIACRLPTLVTDDMNLRASWDAAVHDLKALKMIDDNGRETIAAGLPWFMAIFGRDSLIAALQTLVLGPKIAEGTLRVLSSYQGKCRSCFHCEEPGKIPHEVRRGELSYLNLVPHKCYYGSIDVTPLYLILLSETWRQWGNLDLFEELLPSAEGALSWIDSYGDVDGDGFIEYIPQLEGGLRNQGWKDSADAVMFADGHLAEGPIALCEVQGYIYDAKIRLAELYEAIGRAPKAAELRRQAAVMKHNFNEVFWMPGEQYFALALDGDKRQVNSITSNPGHCLWSGIVSDEKAEAVAKRLLSQDMFTGWGVRTLSSNMEAYNPISYHNGSIWPHDCSIIAAGLVRYGFKEEAYQIIKGMLEASSYFPNHRLPELFAGLPRLEGGFPVRYPDANLPQAWASGAVTLMTQLLLELRPEIGMLECDL